MPDTIICPPGTRTFEDCMKAQYPGAGTTGSSHLGSESGHCSLSPAASAFSAFLSAFIGSIINGLLSGYLIAFATGWISWMGIGRVLISGFYLLTRSITDSWGPGVEPKSKDGGSMIGGEDTATSSQYVLVDSVGAQFEPLSESEPAPPPRHHLLNVLWPRTVVVRGRQGDFATLDQRWAQDRLLKASWNSNLDQTVSVWGWLSWFYTALYAPISQTIWLAANLSKHDNAGAKIAKGMSIAVSALPLCIDCRVRYADSLSWKGGRYGFNLITSITCVLQAVYSAILLIQGVTALSLPATIKTVVIIVYPLFSVGWMYGSLRLVPMRDGATKRLAQIYPAGILGDVLMGAFAGIFLAAPALVILGGPWHLFSSGYQRELAEYLRCASLPAWKKFAAVAP